MTSKTAISPAPVTFRGLNVQGSAPRLPSPATENAAVCRRPQDSTADNGMANERGRHRRNLEDLDRGPDEILVATG